MRVEGWLQLRLWFRLRFRLRFWIDLDDSADFGARVQRQCRIDRHLLLEEEEIDKRELKP